MKFNVFNDFNRLSHFDSREMLVFPSGIYRKANDTFVEHLKMITPFDTEEQYHQALNGLEAEDKAQMQGIKDIDPSYSFKIADLKINTSQENQIFNTALFLLQNPSLHDKTFKIDLFAGINENGRVSTVAYIPKQFAYTEEDKQLKELNQKYYLLAEYYFSDTQVDNHLLQRREINSPHLLVVCDYFNGNQYSLTKDAKYYVTFFDNNSVNNMNVVLDADMRDKYFLNTRGELDKEIRRLVNAKWSSNANSSIIEYTVNPDVVLSKGFDKSIKVLETYKNIVLREDEIETDNSEEDSAETASHDFDDDKEEKVESEPVEKSEEKPMKKAKKKPETIVKFPNLKEKKKHSTPASKETQSEKEDSHETEDNSSNNSGINEKVGSFFGNKSTDTPEDEEPTSPMKEWAEKSNYEDL